jgi:transposase
MKHGKTSTPGKTGTGVAGIDIAKAHLDVALHGGADEACFANDAAGQAMLAGWLRARGVVRVGMEATGGYERGVLACLQAEGFETVLHQPLEVRLFARLKRRRAKTDKLDAVLIAAATAQTDTLKAAADPRLSELAMRLTAYEQAADLLAQARTHREHTTLKDLRARLEAQIRILAAHKKALLEDLLARIRKEADLLRRFNLLLSLPGVGKTIAAVLLIRMPELGAMEHGQAASLLGVAPFNRDSGRSTGEAFIQGGRERPRRFVYLAALAARRCDRQLKAFAAGLLERGKAPKVVLVAIMRKLIEAANLVLKRGRPWTTETTRAA